jgi:hypothetical protein|tara:strand:+ start:611 stop:733 length:123 start_codon:yes stop_codon:yes gene_type:complete
MPNNNKADEQQFAMGHIAGKQEGKRHGPVGQLCLIWPSLL